MSRSSARHAVVVAVCLTAALTTGCTATPAPTPTASGGASHAAPSESAPATASPVALDPDGSATDNLPFFAAIVDDVWASDARAQGRAYIDALSAAGFPKADMEVTADTSTVGNPAESIQFAVRWGQECLVGQVGPATGDPVAEVLPVLAEGTCLIGLTRPIDW